MSHKPLKKEKNYRIFLYFELNLINTNLTRSIKTIRLYDVNNVLDKIIVYNK